MLKLPEYPRAWQVTSILACGVLAVSTAAIFIRLASMAAGISGVGFSLFIAATRLSFAALMLLPAWRGLTPKRTTRGYGYAIAAGICLAVHFATWISSLSFTSIAASVTIVTTNPVWVALLSWLWFREKPTKLTITGIAIALSGGVAIALADADNIHAGSNPLLGDFLALLGAWFASLYFLLGREAQRQGIKIGHYVAIAYTTAAVFLIPLPWLFNTGYRGYPLSVYLYILAMALLSQVFGHTSFNWAVRWISPTLVTLAILFEPVGSSLLGFVLFGEVPGMLVIMGAGILLLGVAIAVIGTEKKAARD